MQEIEKAYTQHAKEVYRYLLSLSHSEDLAEELTQETFFRAMRTIHSYDGSCKLSVWLCQIGKHLWYQWLEKCSHMEQVALTDEIPCQESPGKSSCSQYGNGHLVCLWLSWIYHRNVELHPFHRFICDRGRRLGNPKHVSSDAVTLLPIANLRGSAAGLLYVKKTYC